MKNINLTDARRYGYPQYRDMKINSTKAKRILKLHWIWIALALLSFEYVAFLVVLDITLLLLFILHAIVIEPLMKRGVLKGYYRKDYGPTQKVFDFIKNLFSVGSFIRLAMLFVMLEVVYSKDSIGLVTEWARRIDNSYGVLFGVIIYVLYLLAMYYQERFVRMDTFAKSTAELMQSRNWNSARAAHVMREEIISRKRVDANRGLKPLLKESTPPVIIQSAVGNISPTIVEPVQQVEPHQEKTTKPIEQLNDDPNILNGPVRRRSRRKRE